MAFHSRSMFRILPRVSKYWEAHLLPWTGVSSQDEKQSTFNFLCLFAFCPEYTEKAFEQTFGLSFQGHLSISAYKGFESQLLLGPRSWFLLLNVGVFTAKQLQACNPSPSTHYHLLNEAKHHNSLNDVDLSLNCCFEITTNH